MAATVVHDFSGIDFDSPGKRHYHLAFHLDGTWGYSLVPLTVVVGARGDGPGGVACFGGTHGNEYEGQVAVKRLCADLDPAEMRGRVVLMPRLSESACEANRRESPLDGVNMNRAFPGNPRGSISYRIASFVKREIFPRVSVVLDIHSGGNEGVFPICTSFHPIADPKQHAEMEHVAALFDTQFILVYSSQMASGLLTDEAEAEGKITIGGEFGAGESVNRMGALHAYEGIRNVLRHYGMLSGPVTRIRPATAPRPLLVKAERLEDYCPCPRDAVWEPAVDLGVFVRAGDLLGRLHDFSDHSEPALEVRAPRDGYVLMMHLSARVRRGMTLYVIAREAGSPGAPE
jgi:predicted deacylase